MAYYAATHPYAWYPAYNQAWYPQSYQAPHPFYQAPPPPPPPAPLLPPPPPYPHPDDATAAVDKEEDDVDAMIMCSDVEDDKNDPPAVVPADPRPTREAGFMLKQKMPAPPVARPQRLKGRKVRVHRVGDNHFLPPLEFKSMAACCRHFDLWGKNADGTLKKTINTTRTFAKWIKDACGGIVAEVGDPYGGPYMVPGAAVPAPAVLAPAVPAPAVPAVPQFPVVLPQPLPLGVPAPVAAP